MRARRGEKARDRVGDGTPVPPAVQLAEDAQRRRDLGERRRQVVGEAPERVQAADPLAKREERRVREREERTAQRREQGELVVGTLDRGQHVAERLDLLAPVEGAAADQHVRQVARLERAHVVVRHVGLEGAEAPEEDADVARLDRHARAADPFDRPAALADQPSDERGRRIGQRLLDAEVDDLAEVTVGLGHRQRDDRRLRRDARPDGHERHVGRLSDRSRHARRERGVHGGLDLGDGPEAHRQVLEHRAGVDQPPLHRLVERDVGAPEAIDRLLRIADEEQLPGNRPHAGPVALVGIVGREEQQDLGLERIGVLELVDEDVREARLEVAADGRIPAQQIARGQQEVAEVEAPRALLELLVALDDGLELALQARREVGAGGVDEREQPLVHGVARGAERRLRGRVRTAREAGPRPVARVPAPRELHELGLEPVVVALAADRLAAPDLVHEPRDLHQRLGEVVR